MITRRSLLWAGTLTAVTAYEEATKALASTGVSVDMMQAEIDALTAENARLEAALADCNPPPTATVFGASKPEQTPGLVLPVPGYRTYLQPGSRPTTVAGDTGLITAFRSVPATGGLVWFSIKEEAGDWLDSLLGNMGDLFGGVTVMATADHEPKDGWWDTGRMGQWQARQDSFEAVLGNHPKVEGWTVAEGSSLAAAGAGDAYWTAMLRARQGFGLDSYNGGIQTPKAYKPVADVHGPRFKWITDHGKIPAVGETGTGVVQGDTGRVGQTAWTVDNRAYMVEQKVRASLLWNSGTSGPLGTGCRLTATQMNLWLGR